MMRSLLATLLALSLEGYALITLFDQENFTRTLGLFFILHLSAACLMAYAQSHFLLPLYHTQRKKIILLLCFFSFLAPLIGMVFAWLMVLWGFKKSAQLQHSQLLDIGDSHNNADIFPVTKRIFGEGSLLSILKNKFVPSKTKVNVLLMLSQIKTASSMQMIRSTLADPDDEVRLVGFSIIDNSEKAMNDKISSLLALLEKSNDLQQQALYHEDLAFSYWELLYQGLVDDQLIDDIEASILEHIQEAKQILENNVDIDPSTGRDSFTQRKYQLAKEAIEASLPEHAQEAKKMLVTNVDLYRLEGRVYFKQKKYDLAKKAFVKSLNLGIQQYEVASYMAEISFYEKNFARIPYWMSKISPYSLDYQLLNLSSVWRSVRT